MRVVLRLSGPGPAGARSVPVEFDAEVQPSVGDADVGDLVEAVTGSRPVGPVFVGERRVPPDTPIASAGLHEAVVIATAPPAEPATRPGLSLVTVAGLDAGRRVPLTAASTTVGREAQVAIESTSLSREHFRVVHADGRWAVQDLGSTNGTRVDGVLVPPSGLLLEPGRVIAAGGVAVTVRADHGDDRPLGLDLNRDAAGTGRVAFNRPPRPGSPAPPPELTLPTRGAPASPAHFSMAAVLAPLALAVVMVLMMGDLRYGAMAALSPILGVGTYLEQRRRKTTQDRRSDSDFDAAVETLRAEIDEAVGAERSRRWAACPDPAEVLRRAALPSSLLWQRRREAADLLLLNAGLADIEWAPPVGSQAARAEREITDLLAAGTIADGPAEVDLTDAGVVGVVGDRAAAVAVGRSLLAQAAVHVGPADLAVGVFCDPGREGEWEWTKWLPHTQRPDGTGQWLAADRAGADTQLRSLVSGVDDLPTPALLLLIDSDVLTAGKDAPARTLLGRGRGTRGSAWTSGPPATRVSGIVLAASADRLPASCTVVIDVAAGGEATITHPAELRTVPYAVAAGLSVERARRCALDLARFEDPELVTTGAGLPSMVRLVPLLGLDEVTPAAIGRLWRTSTGVSSPIGQTEQGVLSLDLVADGPHGLVGGTTGSGKSEFLRSLVAGLAARNPPTRLTFVLIDFKGGAAFGALSHLPHTVGNVSNLDAQLADRALRALEAELRHRQRVFAAAGEGVDNLDAYLATDPGEPMPRLLLVIDEFAMLAKDYPDVLRSLVSIAAVGRTLGVHMVLATQRPAGAVNEDILTNTNLRVALRVQSPTDSSNVIDVASAAAIARHQRGRAYVKLGHDEIVPIQTALVSAPAAEASSAAVQYRPFGFGTPPAEASASASASASAERTSPVSELDLLVEAAIDANLAAGYAPARRPWPEPLGERVPLTSLASVDAHGIRFALVDDPDQQRQYPAGWRTGDGNALFLGIPGSGTSTALASVALTLATALPPTDLELLVLDLGSGDLAALAGLPHTAAYVGADERERQVRLLRHLRTELERRRGGERSTRTFVLIDGLAALREAYDDADGLALLDDLYRVYADGPALGLWFAVASDRITSLPPAISELTPQKWVFRLADPYDYTTCGVPAALAPPPVPGRAVLSTIRRHAQVGVPEVALPDAVSQAAERWRAHPARPHLIGRLPDAVRLADLSRAAEITGEPWRVPVGIRESDLAVAELELFEGEHALVSGPARCGKSTLLLTLAAAVRAAAAELGEPVHIWGIGGRRSPLGAGGLDQYVNSAADIGPLAAEARMTSQRVVLLIDDAEGFDDADQSLTGLLSSGPPHLHAFVAGRNDALRTLYGHWTKHVRASRTGVLLQPNIDLDGELLGRVLPRRAPVALTLGRGYLFVNGQLHLVQCATR